MARHRVEGAANVTCCQLLGQTLFGHVATDADQAQLTDLFLQCHTLEQLLDEGRFIIEHGRLSGSQSRERNRSSDQTEQAQRFHFRFPAGTSYRADPVLDIWIAE